MAYATGANAGRLQEALQEHLAEEHNPLAGKSAFQAQASVALISTYPFLPIGKGTHHYSALSLRMKEGPLQFSQMEYHVLPRFIA